MDQREVEAAWAEVTARWDDEAVHRALLARFGDLDGLAEAGRRYKAALDARPGDEVASRWREEVVRRATALALAQLPRTRPPRSLSPGLRRALLLAVVAASAFAVGLILRGMSRALPQVLP